MPLGLRGPGSRAPAPRFAPVALLFGLMLATTVSAYAEDRSGPPRDGGREDLPALRAAQGAPFATNTAPFAASPTAARPFPPRFVRTPAPLHSAEDRPSVLIDAGSPGAAPTEAERAKLAAARAAVERARLAGTLYRLRAALAEEAPLPSDWEAIKRARMHAQTPKPFADEPAAGVGPMPSAQKHGPAGLTPAEEIKRRGPQPSAKDREPSEEGR